MTVQQAIAAFVDAQRAKEIQISSVDSCARTLFWFFDPRTCVLEVDSITPKRASDLINRMSRRLSLSTGRPLSVTTQRANGERAKAFFTFCVASDRIAVNRMDDLAQGAMK